MDQHDNPRIRELLAETTRLENERRMWKNRAQSGRKLLDALILMMQQRFGNEDTGAALIQEVAARADRLERDAWCGAAALVREFIEDANTPMGDYAPDVVKPIDETMNDRHGYLYLTPQAAFIRKWVDRFKAVTNVP